MFSRNGLGPVLLCAATLVFGPSAFAQTKVGVISLQKAVLGTAEITKDQAAMTAKFKPRQDELNSLQAQIQQITQQLQTQADKLTPQAQEDLQANGARLQREAQRKQQDLQEEVDAYRQDVLSKASQKMAEVVKKLAEAKGLDLVVDSSTAIFVKPTIDLTNEAIAAYDKEYPATAAPAPAAAKK